MWHLYAFFPERFCFQHLADGGNVFGVAFDRLDHKTHQALKDSIAVIPSHAVKNNNNQIVKKPYRKIGKLFASVGATLLHKTIAVKKANILLLCFLTYMPAASSEAIQAIPLPDQSSPERALAIFSKEQSPTKEEEVVKTDQPNANERTMKADVAWYKTIKREVKEVQQNFHALRSKFGIVVQKRNLKSRKLSAKQREKINGFINQEQAKMDAFNRQIDNLLKKLKDIFANFQQGRKQPSLQERRAIEDKIQVLKQDWNTLEANVRIIKEKLASRYRRYGRAMLRWLRRKPKERIQDIHWDDHKQKAIEWEGNKQKTIESVTFSPELKEALRKKDLEALKAATHNPLAAE